MFEPFIQAFQVIIDFLHQVLAYFYGVTGNYGLAIILLTVVLRVVTFPLTQKQLQSTQKMQAIQPEIKKLQAKYKNDKTKLNQAQMDLWKKHNVNPAAGCLPLLVQFPVLIGIFRVLQQPEVMAEKIENFSPLFLGIDMTVLVSELSIPVMVLAVVLSAATTFLQQWLMMSDKSQKAMMIVMPIMMGVFSYRFQAGLVLYWTVNNILTVVPHFFMKSPLPKGASEKK